MTEPPVKVAKVRARERVVVNVDSLAARRIGALAVLSVFCWLIVLLARDHHHADWHDAGRLAWSLTILAAVALIARGIFLGRPVTAAHATAAMVVLLAAFTAADTASGLKLLASWAATQGHDTGRGLATPSRDNSCGAT